MASVLRGWRGPGQSRCKQPPCCSVLVAPRGAGLCVQYYSRSKLTFLKDKKDALEMW